MHLLIDAWVVYDSKQNFVYVDHRYSKKDMMQHHCDSLGFNGWGEALAQGHVLVKSTMLVAIPDKVVKPKLKHKRLLNGHQHKTRI